MARSLFRDPSIRQKNDATCIGNKRGMARRAKRNSNKRDRQLLRKELVEEIKCYQWFEHPLMVGVKEALEAALPCWGFKGPYCPGKAGHHSFKATLGEENCKFAHVHETTLEVSVEEMPVS